MVTAADSSRLAKRRPRDKPDAEIILLCNPRAGGRWKELARILDSEEARYVRRIVTDSVEDIAPALADLGHEARLLCIYGGDGTIQRVIDRLTPGKQDAVLALLGGGTMNVTARWCGFSRAPAENFRAVVRAYRSGNLLLKEVPLLEVRRGVRMHRGFTFGMGPVVRILDAYERGRKGKLAALGIGARAITASFLRRSSRLGELTHTMRAEVVLDGEVLPYADYAVVFANVTGQINPGIVPFADPRTRDSFYCAAYSVTARELAVALPLVARGYLPIDLGALLRPLALVRHTARETALPTDPRYVNRTAASLAIRTDEPLYTVDGELLSSDAPEISVTLGPVLKLAVSPVANLRPGLRLAANAISRG
jgi:diacylglycerol kinase family enzyme